MEKIKLTQETQNLFANFSKIAGKSIWSFTLPLILTTESFGIYSRLINFASSIIPAANLGAQQVILRNGRKEDISILLLTIHSLILTLLECLVLKLFFHFSNLQYLQIVCYIFFNITYMNFIARVKSLKRFNYAFVIEFVCLAQFIIFSVCLFLFEKLRVQVLVLETFVFVIASISTFIICRNNFPINLNFKIFKSLLKGIYKVGFIGIIDSILWKLVPIYFIEKTGNYKLIEVVFLFSVLLGNAFVLIPQSVLESWVPTIAEKFHQNNNQTDFKQFYNDKKKMYRKMVLAISVVGFLVSLVSISTIYFKYYGFISVISVFVLLRVIMSIFDLESVFLNSTGNEGKLFIPSAISALVLIILSFLFTKYFGAFGIFYAYMFSKVVLASTTYWRFKTKFI